MAVSRQENQGWTVTIGHSTRMICLGLKKIPHDKNRYDKKKCHCSHSFLCKPIINTPITTRPFALSFNWILQIPWLYFSGTNNLDRMTLCKQDLNHIECAAKWFILIPRKDDFSLHKHESSLPILKFKSAIKSPLAHNSFLSAQKHARAILWQTFTGQGTRNNTLCSPNSGNWKKVAVNTRADLEERLLNGS